KSASNWHYTHESPPMSKLVADILARTDNIVADTVLRAIDIKEGGVGSFGSASTTLTKFLTEFTGLPKRQWKVFDGSGLSHYTMVRPADLARLLHLAYQDPKLYKQLNETLTKSGKDGTLGKRLKSPDMQGIFVAKTATLKYTSGIAGYLLRPDLDPLIVVMLINNAYHPTKDLRGWEDEWLLSLRYATLAELRQGGQSVKIMP
ncbi:MAG: D-alanyl-D-alanine carboxypeptidase, partial [Pseudomonadota bacterium]